ncbi:MAG: hypothetical protein KA165_13710 [Saprospiraceae bacterium]|nr:hypothetical protein [Saprospiraceae bacterium]
MKNYRKKLADISIFIFVSLAAFLKSPPLRKILFEGAKQATLAESKVFLVQKFCPFLLD